MTKTELIEKYAIKANFMILEFMEDLKRLEEPKECLLTCDLIIEGVDIGDVHFGVCSKCNGRMNDIQNFCSKCGSKIKRD